MINAEGDPGRQQGENPLQASYQGDISLPVRQFFHPIQMPLSTEAQKYVCAL
jgi:hypothetical protein